MKTQAGCSGNVYSIETGFPELLVVDATATPNCLACFINDIDPFNAQNCRPVKVYNQESGAWVIAIYATRVIDEEEELRYS